MMHKVFNAANVFGAATLLLMFSVPAAVEGDVYITAVALLAAFAVCAYITVKEDGKRK